MSRYYKPISLEEFKGKIEEVFEFFDNEYDFPSVISKDLAKINFDLENCTRPDDANFANYPAGFRMLAPDFPAFFVNAGGDWEFPICFVLYWDGKQVRGYIPNAGNVYNRTEKCAYGSENEVECEISEPELADLISVAGIYTDVINRIILKE